MNTTGVVRGVRVARDTADLRAVEAARVGDEAAAVGALLDAGADEAVVLQTCHRVEAYVVADDPERAAAALATLDIGGEDAATTDHEASLRHLLRVAAGLESLVLGEDQILGQVRDAYETAREAGGVGPVLEDALTKAIHVGERARTETAINEGATSLGSAAVRLLERQTDLAGQEALVVGAGEMGELAAKALARTDIAGVTVANRSVETAAALADRLDCPARGIDLDGVGAALGQSGVVVAATASPEPVLDAELLRAAEETVVIDLGQPRDAPADPPPNAAVYDIDDLEAVTAATREQREAAAREVEAIVDDELDRLLRQFKRGRADEAIAAMYAGAEAAKERELATALSRLESEGDLTDAQREVVADLADALVSRLLAAPTKSLRAAAEEDDWETIRTALELFDPEFEEGSVDTGPPAGVPDGEPPAWVEDGG
ncbi:MAG: glutamyl-tRNA reductase [Halobacteriaceae archaeon]